MREARILLTGGAGFIGSQIARSLAETGWEVVVLDRLTYAGRREYLDGLPCRLVVGDVCHEGTVREAMQGCAAVIHGAAESHVARSIGVPDAFLRTNVLGTRVILAEAARVGVQRVLHLSTDEVFGAAPVGTWFGEDAPLRPGNAYAASKAGAEALVHAWRHTHGLPAEIVRCTNNYGPRQHPEKAVPYWILAGLRGGPVHVHGEGLAVRDWLHVRDFAKGLLAVLALPEPGDCWHFAGRDHRSNRELAELVLSHIPDAKMACVAERPGQDGRYALDDSATRAATGWAPGVSLEDGIRDTIAWYREHRGLYTGAILDGPDWSELQVV